MSCFVYAVPERMIYMKHFPLLLCALTFTGLIMNLPAAQAGAGIGVDLPLGTSSSATIADSDTYAAFTCDQLKAEASIQEKKSGLTLELKLTNPTNSLISIGHRCGQSYDFILLDKEGNQLYCWSKNMAFTQALTQTDIPPKGSVVYNTEIPETEYRTYRNKAVLARMLISDTNYTITMKIPHEEHHDSSPVTFHGGISIGSYHGW